MSEITLTPDQASRAYDWLARPLALARHYENLATDRLIPHAAFGEAQAVYEFGCGTGHYAERLLSRHLSPAAQYKAVDVTPRMVALSRQRLVRFGDRVLVELSDGGAPREPAGSCDRFVCNYVLDLLPEAQIEAVLDAAHRMLRSDGLLCLASLAPAQGLASRPVMGLWQAIHRFRPALVGGCRPLVLRRFLDDARWELLQQSVIGPLGIPLEAVLARRREPAI